MTNKKTICLVETEDIRTLKAASEVNKIGFANILLVGNEDEIKSLASANNIDLNGVKIINDSYTLPRKSEYFNFVATQIFDYQVCLLESSNKISVLNTCIFALVDFAPSKFFGFVFKHKDNLWI